MNKKLLLFSLLLTPLASIGCNKSNPRNIPLYIECTEGNTTIGYTYYPDETGEIPDLQYSFDLKQWNKIHIDPNVSESVNITKLNKGQRIYFHGDNPEGFNYYNYYGESSMTKNFSFKFVDSSEVKLKIGGNIMSLVSIDQYNTLKEVPCEGCFFSLFNDFSGINEEYTDFGNVDASELQLPATNLKEYAYCWMFHSSSLSKAPTLLPAEVAKQGMYESMFDNNQHLVTAPIIKLKNLEESSCSQMFYYCSELNISKDKGKTKIFTCPKLNGEGCVSNMFDETKNPDLPENPSEGEVYYFN